MEPHRVGCAQGVTKRRRLSWLTNSALVYEPKFGGKGGVAGSQPMSTFVLCTWSPKNFEDQTPYLTYGFADPMKSWNADPNLEESKNAA
jgi:hypothetical protein